MTQERRIAANIIDAQLRRWHFRLRKKEDVLREKALAIEKITDFARQQKEWNRYMKRSLAISRETTDYIRALADHALGWETKTKRASRHSKKKD